MALPGPLGFSVKRTALNYSFAVAVTLAAAGLRYSMGDLLGLHAPGVLFLLAISLSAWLGGWGCGLLATAISAVLGKYLFMEPLHSFIFRDQADVARSILFVLVGLSISGLSGAMHRSERQLRGEIAERKLLEKRIRQDAEIFQALADSLPALVWMSGEDRLCNFFNKRWLQFTGKKLEQECGNGWEESVHPDDLNRCTKTYQSHFDRREPYEMHYRLRRHDGEYRWIIDRGEPRYHADGGFAGYTGACLDVHESYLAEEKTRSQDRQLSLILKTAKIGTWELDLTRNLLVSSAQCRANFGLSEDEPLPYAGLYDYILPEYHIPARVAIQRALNDPAQDYEVEYQVRWPDKTLHWLLLKGQVVRDPNGTPLRVVGMSWDQTAHKESELAMQQALKHAEEASIAKSDFLANMSHELRTPLNAVVGLSHLLHMSNSIADRERMFVTTLKNSADSLLLLINDILDFAKLESGRLDLEQTAFDPALLVEEVLAIIEVQTQQKRLALNRHLVIPEGLRLVGDPLRIRQILMNLLSNAVKFTERGDVSLNATVTLQETGVLLTFRISDSGIGIAPEKAFAIFDKFTQADASTTRKYGGTGLGLAITKSLTERMNGTIRLESEPGKGSAFTVSLPLAASTAFAPPKTAKKTNGYFPHGRLQPKILLIEDYEPNIVVAIHILENFGYQPDVARSGREALDRLRSTSYALILMDVQMQDMDGMETTRRIRAKETAEFAPRTPIIAVTAHALSSDRDRCLASGMDDYIAKPFDPEQLRQKIDGLLRGAEAA